MTEAPHVLVVEARFYEDIADELVKGAVACIEGADATYERIDVPGALEIPAAIRMAIKSLQHVLAIGYGILTCETREQAWSRAAVDQGDKGGVAARAALRMVELKKDFGLYPR